ncbi:MAG: very short patch repair endonuclease [Bacilli bacterium]|jgi:DNA mismatch endonuclease (patch repair protein)|nr:very short patch repair endonuclease [Bacilli bacterium]
MKRSKEQISAEMALIRGKNTNPELKLRKALFSRGLRYRVNYGKILGHPDIAFPKEKIVIFVDGDFWHGRDWENRKKDIKSHRSYWLKKIETNMKRDNEYTLKLQQEGYLVIRLWENDINKDVSRLADIVEEAYKTAKNPYGEE